MEIINAILREMRKDIPRVVDAKVILRNYADRIEAEVKAIIADRDNWRRQALDEDARANATRDKSSQIGNVAELREVCQKMIDILMSHGDGRTHCILTWDEFNNAQKMIRASLYTPPRNCDRFKPDEALSAYIEDKGITQPLPLWYGNEFWAFINWLFDNAKREEQ